MHPKDCPEWEYDHHSQRVPILKKEHKSVLLGLRKGKIDTLSSVLDTRQIHYQLFCQLTPDSCEYYAGHYRGEDYRCLKHIRVGIRSDPRVGTHPQLVLSSIDVIAKGVNSAVTFLDKIMIEPEVKVPLNIKIVNIVAVACKFFEVFLRVHPYVNGNGHIARFCLWSLLGRYGYWPSLWPIDPSPNPPYVELIIKYRNGDKVPLESFIMSTLQRV